MFRATLLPPALLATLVFAACSGGGGSDPVSVSGTIQFVPEQLPLTSENEPNDSLDAPQMIGELAAGRTVVIRGRIAAGEGFDAFSFVAPARVSIHARVEGALASSLELGLYDPLALRLETRASASAGVRGTARGAFDVLVRAPQGAGEYALIVSAEALVSVASEGWVGCASVGDTCSLVGQERAHWSLTSADAQALIIAGTPGASYDVQSSSGTLLAQGAQGETRVELAPLERIEITAAADDALRLELRSEALGAASSARPVAPLARLDDERAAWGLGADAALYGDPRLPARRGELLVLAQGDALLSDELARRNAHVKDRIPGGAQLVGFELDAALDARAAARATLAMARSLACSPRVAYAELNLIRQPLGIPAQGAEPLPRTRATHTASAQQPVGGPITNDTFVGLQWHYPLIDLPEAWTLLAPGPDVIVAVIDTGERAHVDLNANLIAGFDFISDAGVAEDGDGLDADPTDEGDGVGPAPSSFHGTHVAGTIAAVTNNGTGVAGVCGPLNRTKVMQLRVLGQGGGTDFDIAQAILYAAGLANNSGGVPAAPARVINLSLGGPGSTTTAQNAITAARNAGVTIFAAAGNDNTSQPFFPAAYAGVISISAVDLNAEKAPYSNFGNTVDLAAPGGNTSVDLNGDTYADGVLSTLIDEGTGNPVYSFYQGTSMACPHAAGVAALMLQANGTLTPAQVEGLLDSGATDIGAPGNDIFFGSGLINAFTSVQLAGGTLPTTPVLSVSPGVLNFGDQPSVTTLSIQVSNIGGGTLDVTDVSDDQPWITTTNVPSTGSSNVSAVNVTVDRSLLVAADSGLVTVVSNGGTATVQITAAPEDTTAPVDVDLFVLLVNVDTLETIAQTIVNPSIDLDYLLDANSLIPDDLEEIPEGDYLLVCGSDDNDDGFICGVGDIYCGLFPTINDPQVLSLSDPIGGYDFVVGPESVATTSAGTPPEGFRLLRQ
jgi:subtilisin family serine protease